MATCVPNGLVRTSTSPEQALFGLRKNQSEKQCQECRESEDVSEEDVSEETHLQDEFCILTNGRGNTTDR